MNPVLARETRERFRTRRAMVFLTLWVLGMGLVTYAIYLLGQQLAQGQFSLGRLVATGFLGRFLFQSTTLLLVTAVIFVVPGLTALAIVGERERQTLQLLQVTQLSGFQLVVGKLTASIGYFVLLLVAVLPIASIPLLFGGTAIGDVLAALGVLVLTAVMVAALSMWVSARARSSRGAVAGSYVIAFVFAFLTLVGMVGELLLIQPEPGVPFGEGGREVWSVLPNPYFAMVSAVDQPLELRQDSVMFASPYTPFEALLFRRQGVRTGLEGFVEGVAPGVVQPRDGRQMLRLTRPPLWVYTAAIYGILIAVALWRAAHLVRAPASGRRRSLRRRPRDAAA